MPKFEVDEKVVINTEAIDLKSLNGTLATIRKILPDSNFQDYVIEYDVNGNRISNRVREKELQEINNKEILDMNVGDKVIYAATGEEVTIGQIDYLHGQVSITFKDGGSVVCGIEAIRKKEADIEVSQVHKFNIGDKVRINTTDKWDGMIGEVKNKLYKDIEQTIPDGYDVSLLSDIRPFDENELELIEEAVINGSINDKDLHRKILDEIHHTYKIKNADYGNSFGEQYHEYGLLSSLIRLDDKMRRLKQLNKQEAQVKDESIRDTVLDLANYAIMTVMELDKQLNK